MPKDIGIAHDRADELFHDGIHGKIPQDRLTLFQADEDAFIEAVYGGLYRPGRQLLLVLLISLRQEADQAPSQASQGQD